MVTSIPLGSHIFYTAFQIISAGKFMFRSWTSTRISFCICYSDADTFLPYWGSTIYSLYRVCTGKVSFKILYMKKDLSIFHVTSGSNWKITQEDALCLPPAHFTFLLSLKKQNLIFLKKGAGRTHTFWQPQAYRIRTTHVSKNRFTHSALEKARPENLPVVHKFPWSHLHLEVRSPWSLGKHSLWG